MMGSPVEAREETGGEGGHWEARPRLTIVSRHSSYDLIVAYASLGNALLTLRPSLSSAVCIGIQAAAALPRFQQFTTLPVRLRGPSPALSPSPASVMSSEDAVRTPVLIVGGGLVGLSTGLFLQGHNVPFLLIEKMRAHSILPRSRGIHVRVCELFRR